MGLCAQLGKIRYRSARHEWPHRYSLKSILAVVLVCWATEASIGQSTAFSGCVVGRSQHTEKKIKNLTIAASDVGRTVVLGNTSSPSGRNELIEFLKDGGSIAVRSSSGDVVDFVTQDSPLGKIGLTGSVGESRSLAIAVDRSADLDSISALGSNRRLDSIPPGGSIPQVDDVGVLVSGRPLVGLQFFPRDHSIYGQVIDDFDGIPVPPLQLAPQSPQPIMGEQSESPVTIGQLAPATAAAVVAIYFRRADSPGVIPCNGVQIAPGLILTNLHCANAAHTGYVVHFGNLQQGLSDTILPGTVVTGDVRCTASVVSPIPASPRQDFALLKISDTVPEPFRAAILPLERADELTSTVMGQEVRARQVQYWLRTGSQNGTPYQKYEIPAPSCKIRRRSPLDTASWRCPLSSEASQFNIDPEGVIHLCDSEEGSSGSPLLNEAGDTIIALHRAWVPGPTPKNCAVPAAAIRRQLVSWGINLN